MTYNFPNGTTPDVIIQQTTSQVPILSLAILGFIYLTFTVAIYAGHRKLSGSSNFGSSMVFGGIITSISALIMILIGDIIDIEAFYLCAAITCASIVFYFINGD